MFSNHTRLGLLWWSVVAFVLALAGAADGATQSGQVQGNGGPIGNATVRLFAAGDTVGSGAIELGSTMAGPNGRFAITYDPPMGENIVLYLIADGVDRNLRLAALLGDVDLPKKAIINELSTVATAFTMAQFIDGDQIGGNRIGVRNGARIFRNFVNLETGQTARMMAVPPNGIKTFSYATYNAMSNMLSSAMTSPMMYELFFDLATPPFGGDEPTDTLQAMVNIAHHPGHNVEALWMLSLANPINLPTLEESPEAWLLTIKYVGNFIEFDGPGNVVFDAEGNAYFPNNYTFRRDHSLVSCGSKHVIALTPDGRDLPNAPYTGGGVDGAGFGVTLDTWGTLWISNFGFFGNTCPEDERPPANSVSRFSTDGIPLSPVQGYTLGGISSPQSIVSDQSGNIWIANSCNGTVTQYLSSVPGDEPQLGWIHTVDPAAKPFAIWVDDAGDAWVTDNHNETIFKLSGADGSRILGPFGGDGTGVNLPMGIVVDQVGNIWVSNSALIRVPCASAGDAQDYGDLEPDLLNSSVTQFAPDGTVIGIHQNPGLVVPWGIAVDGDGHVWVGNFFGQRVGRLCGSDPAKCPPGMSPGDPLGPAAGYPSDALERTTGLGIDLSGNVWATNNWLIDAVQTNPGGDGVVLFIGVAAPVVAPLIGPAQPFDDAPSAAIAGDLNNDGRVDRIDVGRVIACIGSECGDLDGDGDTDVVDLAIVLNAWTD